MDTKFYFLLFSILVLAVSGLTYGVLFLRRRNYLLGIEWLIVGFSGANFLAFFLSGNQSLYSISYFFDAFSRGFGIPVIAVAGLMILTHGYKPTLFAEIWLFVVSIVGAVILVSSSSMLKPYFYVLMWTVYSVFLLYFIKRLLSAGEKVHAVVVSLALLTNQAIASIYDFCRIPGDSEQVIFYTLAGLSWSLNMGALYYAYGALERLDGRWFPAEAPRASRA